MAEDLEVLLDPLLAEVLVPLVVLLLLGEEEVGAGALVWMEEGREVGAGVDRHRVNQRRRSKRCDGREDVFFFIARVFFLRTKNECGVDD